MSATEESLRSRTPEEVTLREIASAASTTEPMIHYYFGNKEGLLVAMSDYFLATAPHYKSPGKVIEACVAARSIRPFVEIAVDFYFSRPELMRMNIMEIVRGNSGVKSNFVKKYARRTPALVATIIDHLVDIEAYRADLDRRFAVMSVMAMLVFPVVFEIALPTIGTSTAEIKGGAWARYVTNMLDSQFAAPL